MNNKQNEHTKKENDENRLMKKKLRIWLSWFKTEQGLQSKKYIMYVHVQKKQSWGLVIMCNRVLFR